MMHCMSAGVQASAKPKKGKAKRKNEPQPVTSTEEATRSGRKCRIGSDPPAAVSLNREQLPEDHDLTKKRGFKNKLVVMLTTSRLYMEVAVLHYFKRYLYFKLFLWVLYCLVYILFPIITLGSSIILFIIYIFFPIIIRCFIFLLRRNFFTS